MEGEKQTEIHFFLLIFKVMFAVQYKKYIG